MQTRLATDAEEFSRQLKTSTACRFLFLDAEAVVNGVVTRVPTPWRCRRLQCW